MNAALGGRGWVMKHTKINRLTRNHRYSSVTIQFKLMSASRSQRRLHSRRRRATHYIFRYEAVAIRVDSVNKARPYINDGELTTTHASIP